MKNYIISIISSALFVSFVTYATVQTNDTANQNLLNQGIPIVENQTTSNENTSPTFDTSNQNIVSSKNTENNTDITEQAVSKSVKIKNLSHKYDEHKEYEHNEREYEDD